MTRQHGIVAIHQSNRMTGGDFCGNGIPEQTINGIFHHNDTLEVGVVAHRNVKLNLGFSLPQFLPWFEGDGRRKNGLAKFFGQRVGVFGFCVFKPSILAVQMHHVQTAAAHLYFDTTELIDPKNGIDFGVLLEKVGSLLIKLGYAQLFSANVSGKLHHVLLLLQKMQAHFLVGVFQIALNAFLLSLHFLVAQVTHAADNGQKKNGDRGYRCQHGHPVLSVGRLFFPPSYPAPGKGLDQLGDFLKLHRA